MTAYQQKAVRDFWRDRTRTILVVLAIAAGIAGFDAVLSSYAILTRELNNGYLGTNPASAILRTDAIDDALVAVVRANPDVAAAEPRRIVSGRLKTGPAEWRQMTLFVVQDYGNIRISKVEPQRGAWPPGKGEILIERDALQVARAPIGGAVTVKTNNGTEQTLRVAGTVKDVGQAQARMENMVYGYITLDTLAQLGERPYLDRLNILVAENRFDQKHIERVAGEVKKAMEGAGHPVSRVDIPPPGKHPHASIMGLLLLAMSAFGFAILVLSGILVVNLLTAMMAAEIRQIGMMKAIGGTRRQIAGIYFSQAALLGAAAILVAFPAGLWGARAMCRAMAVFLNFDITSFAVPAWVYLLVAAVGIVVPLLSAAYPVWQGSGVSVREALADFGVPADAFGTEAFDRVLARLGGVFRPLLLALRNSFRRRNRFALTLITLAAGGVFFMSALNIRGSLVRTLDHLFAARKFDLAVSFGGMYRMDQVDRALAGIGGVRRTEGWILTEGTLHTDSGERFNVIALPAGSRLQQVEIAVGRGLEPSDVDAIVVNGALAAKLPGVKPGDTVTLRIGPSDLAWRVVGIANEPFSGPLGYIPRARFDQLGGHAGTANSLRIALDSPDDASIRRVREGVDRGLEREGLRTTGSSTKSDGRYGFDQHMLMIYVFLVVVSALIAGIGGLGLMTTMSLNVLERRREMGVLRAIGASPGTLWFMIVAEGVLTGVLAWALASLVAWPLSKGLGDWLVSAMFQTSLAFRFEPMGPLVWLGVSILLGVTASFLPAWHASRMTVREALAYE